MEGGFIEGILSETKRVHLLVGEGNRRRKTNLFGERFPMIWCHDPEGLPLDCHPLNFRRPPMMIVATAQWFMSELPAFHAERNLHVEASLGGLSSFL